MGAGGTARNRWHGWNRGANGREPEERAGTGGTAGIAGCGANRPGPAMVEIASGSGRYCIDSTEVTNNDYAAFLATNPATTGQPAQCSWNIDYTPSDGWPVAAGAGRLPVGFVDWCDATAYCRWAGKRLCGRIGEGLQCSRRPGEPGQESVVQCLHGGRDQDIPVQRLLTAQTRAMATNTARQPHSWWARCRDARAGVSGIYDMSGNVWEWEDSCSGNTGKNDSCQARGGAYLSPRSAAPLRFRSEILSQCVPW